MLAFVSWDLDAGVGGEGGGEGGFSAVCAEDASEVDSENVRVDR